MTDYPRTASNPTATAPNSDAITIAGNSTVFGFFYAPYARLQVSGGANVFGSLSALEVMITGGSAITVPDDGRTKPPSPTSTVSGNVAGNGGAGFGGWQWQEIAAN
jgi:hypothetical protein